MQTPRFLLLLVAAPLMVPVASGCVFLHAPEVDPTPTPAATPKAPFFDPTAGQPRGTALNKAADPVFPDAFRIAGALAGDRVTIQSVDTVQTGTAAKPVVTIGTPDRVRLAGIVAPTTEPSLSLAKKTISDWTVGRDVDVDLDAKYPTDLDGVRVVEVFYKGRDKGAKGEPGPFAGQTLSLNRMLVRSGMAVVDLYSPTSFDTSQWLLDEAYARRHKLGFWKFGVAIQQRIPVSLTVPGARGSGARSKVSIQPTIRAGATGTTTQTTSQSSQTTTSATTSMAPGTPPGTAPAPGAPPMVPAAPNAATGR